MDRRYLRFKVTGTETLDSGKRISCSETGICTEYQDPMVLAMKRNDKMVKCTFFMVEVEPAFTVRESKETQTVKEYRNMTNRRREYGQITRPRFGPGRSAR